MSALYVIFNISQFSKDKEQQRNEEIHEQQYRDTEKDNTRQARGENRLPIRLVRESMRETGNPFIRLCRTYPGQIVIAVITY